MLPDQLTVRWETLESGVGRQRLKARGKTVPGIGNVGHCTLPPSVLSQPTVGKRVRALLLRAE
jgi:hypothetical protein